MRKGPRGGGRDRDRIIRHTIRTEGEDFAKKVGVRMPEGAALTPDGLRQHREATLRSPLWSALRGMPSAAST
jgi:hypothetical protein